MKKMAWMSVVLLTLSSAAEGADSAVEIWRGSCRGCHGEDGRAQTRMGRREKIPDFTTPLWQSQAKDQEIRDVIADGSANNPKMGAYKKKLTSEEIDALVQYIRTLKQE